jgi:single-strand DNA-binding protein
MNKVFLIGNLTRDPELTETNTGVSLCRFSIAVNRSYSAADGERKTDFFNIVAWRGLGENVSRYAKKGNKVAVTGSIELRNYEDNQGVKRTAVDIVAQDVEFLTPKGNGSDYSAPDSNSTPAPHERKRASLQAFDDDSDIPF